MATLEFAFNQDELNALIDLKPMDNLLVSIVSFKETGEPSNEIYLATQTCDPTTNQPDTSLNLVKACPSPPGWKTLAGMALLPHEKLVNCPKFVVPAAEKAKLKQTPLVPGIPVTVVLNAVIIDGNMKSVATFTNKDAAGTVIATYDAAVS